MPEADTLPHVCIWVGVKDAGKRHQKKRAREIGTHSQIHLEITGLTSLPITHEGALHILAFLGQCTTWTTIHGSPGSLSPAALLTVAYQHLKYTHPPSLLPQTCLSTLFQSLETPRSPSHTRVFFPQLLGSPIITLHTHAFVATVDLQVFRWADTSVVPQSVVAGTRATDA